MLNVYEKIIFLILVIVSIYLSFKSILLIHKALYYMRNYQKSQVKIKKDSR